MFAAENAAFEWFYHELGFKKSVKLYSLIRYIRLYGPNKQYHYRWLRPEGSDHARLLMVPEELLVAELEDTLEIPVRMIHHKIKRFLRREFERKPWSYGFMGGSCELAAHQQKNNRSFLKFDIRHAFFNVGHELVFDSLSTTPIFGKRHYGSLSKWVARFIADICTAQAWPEIADRYNCFSFLPQGSPTSPILFDIACSKFDEQLSKIANRVEGTFTRYADNIEFGMKDRTFPPKVRRAILHEAMVLFPIHKVSESNDGKPFRMLGLQIVEQEVRMTRAYKRKLRGALHHLSYAAEHNKVDKRTLQQARGLMSFAVLEQLSPQTIAAFQANCKQQT